MDTISYIYSPQYLHVGDKVYASLKREGENYMINTCPIIITDRTDYLVAEEPYLTLNKNNTNKKMDIMSRLQGIYQIYDVIGHQVQYGTIKSGIQTINIDQNVGTYILFYIADDGHSETHKFIIR